METARKAEDLGYSTLVLPDHVGTHLAPVPALVSAADATASLRVGTLVLCNDLRHPVVLAQEAATVDLLTDGRLELGLGAGWMVADYQATGRPLDPAAERVARLEESVHLIRSSLDGRPVDFSGRYYTVSGHQGRKPVQPRLPVLVGGGSRRVLETAGRVADIVSIHHDLRSGAARNADVTAEMTQRKLAWVRAGAADRFADLELQVGLGIFWVTNRSRNVLEGLGRHLGISPEQVADIPNVLVGSEQRIAEVLQQRREQYGFNYIVVQGRDLDAAAPVVRALAGS